MKVAAVVQARMGSSRLPGKVMATLAGRPLIEVLLHRLSKSALVSSIVLATSVDPLNDPLELHVRRLGYPVFRGSEQDVLARFYFAAAGVSPDAVVRITGDCPLVDAALVDTLIETYVSENVDYVSNVAPPTFPDGLDVEVFAFAALADAHRRATTTFDREHVTPFLRSCGRFRLVNVRNDEDWSAERWTVDEPEDLAVVSAVFAHFAPETCFRWRDVHHYLQSRPDLRSLNRAFQRNEGSLDGRRRTARRPGPSGRRQAEGQ